MNFSSERITLDGAPYMVMHRCGTLAHARRRNRQLAGQVTYFPGKGWLVLLPIDPKTGLPITTEAGSHEPVTTPVAAGEPLETRTA